MKTIVVCSMQSLVRRNVVDEIIEAIEHEQKHGDRKLVPVLLDDYQVPGVLLVVRVAGETRSVLPSRRVERIVVYEPKL
ncbi:MAG: hypothetical protein ACR2HJ_13040 [Fimbriimonadales bacterium]